MKTTKTFIILLLIIFIVACSHQTVKDDNSIVYKISSDILFEQWLPLRKKLILLSTKQQQDYFKAEQWIYSQSHQLGTEQLRKLEFVTQYNIYSLAKGIVKKNISKKIEIDSSQVNVEYEKSLKWNQNKKKKLRLYQIFKKYPNQSEGQIKAALLKEVETLRSKVTSLEHFKSLALTESDSQTRLNYGLIGNVPDGYFDEPLNSIIMNLKPGQLSSAIKTDTGIMLFYCEKIIEPRLLTQDQLMEMTKSRFRNFQIEQNWKKFKVDLIADQNLKINFKALVNEDGLNTIIVKGKDFHLNLSQFKWLNLNLNLNLNNQRIIDQVSRKKVTRVIENYALNYLLYKQLLESEIQILKSKFKLNMFDTVVNQVLAKMINQRLKIPNEKEILDYYNIHKHKFMKDEQFHISAIAMDFVELNKVEKYNKAHAILDSIKLGELTFNDASKQYSYLNKRFPDGKMTPLSVNQLSGRLGINVKKQIEIMNVNELSKIVESSTGILWIVKIDQIEPKRVMTFSEAQKLAHNQLGNQRAQMMHQQIYQELFEKLEL